MFHYNSCKIADCIDQNTLVYATIAMDQIIFSNSSHIEIQGDVALRFQSVNHEMAIYEVVGFESYPVIIQDYRRFGLEAINSLLIDNRLYDFAPKFNRPSDVMIIKTDAGKVEIILKETFVKNPAFMLWIAIGMEEPPPNYNYLFREILPFERTKLALLALYRRPHRRIPIIASPYLVENILNS